MKVTVIVPLISIVIGYIGNAYAQHESAGTTFFSFTTLDYDARSMALSGAAVAVASDLAGVYANPATIGYIDSYQAQMGIRSIMWDSWCSPISVAVNTGKYGVVAGNFLYNSEVENLTEVLENQQTTENKWSVYGVLGSASWAKIVWRQLATGVSLKGLYYYMGSTAAEQFVYYGSAADFGAQYRNFNSRVIGGIVLRNIGLLRRLDSGEKYRWGLPTMFEAGISFIPRQARSVRLAFDINKTKGQYITFKTATEIMVNSEFVVRAGYSLSQNDIEHIANVIGGQSDRAYVRSNINSLSLGAGLIFDYRGIKTFLDVAFVLLSDVFGGNYGLTLRTDF